MVTHAVSDCRDIEAHIKHTVGLAEEFAQRHRRYCCAGKGWLSALYDSGCNLVRTHWLPVDFDKQRRRTWVTKHANASCSTLTHKQICFWIGKNVRNRFERSEITQISERHNRQLLLMFVTVGKNSEQPCQIGCLNTKRGVYLWGWFTTITSQNIHQRIALGLHQFPK